MDDANKKLYGTIEEGSTLIGSEQRLFYKDFAPFASEFAGTFLLCLTIGLAAGLSDFADLATGSALMVSIFMGGHISGAHHNPAVTLAVVLAGKMKTGMFNMGPVGCALGYMVSQVLASFAAGLVAYLVSKDMGEDMGKPQVSEKASWASAILIEIIFTFFLALVVLNVATTRANEGNSFYGLAIGFLVFVATTTGGPVSGGAFNPAVGTGLPFMSGHHSAMADVWIYWIGPMSGAFLASLFFNTTVFEE